MIKLNSIVSKINIFGIQKWTKRISTFTDILTYQLHMSELAWKKPHRRTDSMNGQSVCGDERTYIDCKSPINRCHSPLLWTSVLWSTLTWWIFSFEDSQIWLVCVGSIWYCFYFSFFHQIYQERGVSALCRPRAYLELREGHWQKRLNGLLFCWKCWCEETLSRVKDDFITGLGGSVIDGFLEEEVVS